VAALTGTASAQTLEDVSRLLGLAEGALIAPLGLGRGELRFRIVRCASGEKSRRLVDILRLYAGRASALTFCPHVEGEFGAQGVARALRSAGLEAGVYHGKPPRGEDERTWRGLKGEAAELFRRQCAGLLVATKAFGLGIDKPDVRATVHIGLPSSPEGLWQAAGPGATAGRRTAGCWPPSRTRAAPVVCSILGPRTRACWPKSRRPLPAARTT
jgi:ATP-dependent DNA helicase RecQ